VKVFLSHSFRPEDRHLVAKIDSLLGAQDVLVATGRRLGGAAITPEILRRIETTDALVALLTRRERIGEEEAGRWTTHNWNQLCAGRDKGRRVCRRSIESSCRSTTISSSLERSERARNETS
jgi:hypothetical protein